MNIIDATTEALKCDGVMIKNVAGNTCYLKPTGSPNHGYIMLSLFDGTETPKWHPDATDILSTKWVVFSDETWQRIRNGDPPVEQKKSLLDKLNDWLDRMIENNWLFQRISNLPPLPWWLTPAILLLSIAFSISAMVLAR